MEIVGLIPAGGIASRLGKSPCSKEVFPLGLDNDNKITVVSENCIRYFRLAGAQQIYFILRKGKWDIPEFYGDGSGHGTNIGYLIMNLPFGTPFTVDQAYPFVKDKIVMLGYPDIIITPEDSFASVTEKLVSSGADLMLGLFPIENYSKWDMVEFDADKKIKNIVIKQDRPDLKLGWTDAVWKPRFTDFMHNFLEDFIKKNPDGKIHFNNGTTRELYVGDVIQAAINEGLNVGYTTFNEGTCIDLGTPEDLKKYLGAGV